MFAKRKWRPTLAMIVFAVLATVLALPVAGLSFFRLFENELMRQTERELIAQSAVLQAIYANEVEKRLADGLTLGPELPKERVVNPDARLQPLLPALNLAEDEIKEPRPDARLDPHWPEQGYLDIGSSLAPVVDETRKRTLAGFRILDPKGSIIVGRGDTGLSLAHVEEVKAALEGRYSSALRERISDSPPPPVYSLSRGTLIRVFVALPVVVKGRMAGVVYASRTPSNIVKYLYGQRQTVFLAALTVAVAALLVGFVFWRTVTCPIHELIRRTEAMSQGDRAAIRPLAQYGTREITLLSQSFFAMAKSLFDRSDFVRNFAAHVSHELKSPLTSIQGAAELLKDSEKSMTREERQRFFDNIVGDTQRLTALLQRLRELAEADSPPAIGSTSVSEIVAASSKAFPSLTIESEGDVDAPVSMSLENASIVLKHLIDNAERHNATAITVTSVHRDQTVSLVVSDDGDGISEHNRTKIFDSFFTTRRDQGGTGMGLGIARTMLHAHGGSIDLLPSERGASFEIRLPAGD